MRICYNSLIFLYSCAIQIAALFNNKAKLWVRGRKNIFEQIQGQIAGNKSDIIWVHCASLGEFEQGRPLIEELKKQYPGYKIFLTFFSPSGYEIRKHYAGADYIFYLPADMPANAQRFISMINPKIAVFVKYEFWFNYLLQLKYNNIPTYLISGIFRNNHYFFKWYGAWGKKQLNCFSHFFLQNAASEKLLHSIGYKNTTVAGDTRFDRVFEISKNTKKISLIELFQQNKKIIIGGSTWLPDEELLSTLHLTTMDYKLIIAPHEINEMHIKQIEQLFYDKQKISCIRYSQANEHNIVAATILIIDNIGMLSSLYRYGTIAYIGGGFGKGIHNTLEAAVFGLPVLFGPNYHKFSEAIELISRGGAFVIKDSGTFKNCIDKLTDSYYYNQASVAAKSYVESNTGATKKIMNLLALE